MLAETVREAARRFGDLVAFVDPDGRPLTYRSLDRSSDDVAAGFAARGVTPGDRVVLRLPSDTSYVVAYAAAAKLGAITAGINPRLAPPEQDALADLADPTLVLTDRAEVDSLETAGRDAGVAPSRLPRDPTRPVAIVFTSGTTGRPKGAVFTEAQLTAVTQIDTGRVWADAPGPAMLASTQFAHVGFMTKLPWYLRLATRTHVLGHWRADDALGIVAEQRMPSIGGVAPQIALLLRSPELARHDWSHVHMLVVGGAASPPELIRQAQEAFGAAYSIRYSSTESGGCGTALTFAAGDPPEATAEVSACSVGRPRPGVEATVQGDDGELVMDRYSSRVGGPAREAGSASTAVGELWLRSPAQMAGYWRDPRASAATITEDGWLRTGDLAHVDERGDVVLAGRRSDMFIRGGYNVFPAEVEAQLLAHPGIVEAAVVPLPDPVMGEVGLAVVVARDSAAPPMLDDLREFLSTRLASYKLPEALRVVDALPLTSMQKVDRQALTTEN